MGHWQCSALGRAGSLQIFLRLTGLILGTLLLLAGCNNTRTGETATFRLTADVDYDSTTCAALGREYGEFLEEDITSTPLTGVFEREIIDGDSLLGAEEKKFYALRYVNQAPYYDSQR